MKHAFHSKRLRLQKWIPRLGKREPDAEIISASRENAKFAFTRKDKKAWFRIDLASIKCSMERISAFNDESSLVKLASSEEREKWKKRKVECLDNIPVSGKTPKTPEKSKK